MIWYIGRSLEVGEDIHVFRSGKIPHGNVYINHIVPVKDSRELLD